MNELEFSIKLNNIFFLNLKRDNNFLHLTLQKKILFLFHSKLISSVILSSDIIL